jgi:hypothetical protein
MVDAGWSRGDILTACGVGVAVVGILATPFNPQFQEWWKQRSNASDPITLGNLEGAKPYEVSLAPGIVKADSATLADLQKALPSASIDWLHQKDFGNAFPRDAIEKMEEFNWRHTGPEHEFIDAELEAMRLELISCIEQFASSAGWNTVCINPGADREFRKIPDLRDENGKYSDRLFFQKAKEINDAAEAVWKAYLALVRRARLKLAIGNAETNNEV